MNEMNFDWDDLRLFLAVARAGGLASAAASTGKSAPTLGRRMLALERRLGRELFHRMARGYGLTEDGAKLLRDAAALETRLLPILETDPERARFVVKISAGTWVTYLLCGNAADLARTDSVKLRFIAAEELSDIGRREALIGIRNRRPQGVGLAGRRIGRVRFAVYAKQPDIAAWARFTGSTPSAVWLRNMSDKSETFEVTHPRNALDLALAGVARTVLPTFIGGRFPDLQRISAPIPELDHDQWLVTHHEDRFISEIRAVIDRTYGILKAVCAAS